MVHPPEKMSGMIEEDTNSSSYLSPDKMKYIDIDLNSDSYMCNQYNDEFKELTRNISDTISTESQIFQNGTSSNNVTELKSCIHQNNILNQELNSQVYQNSNLDNEITTMKSYPPKHTFRNKLCQISSLSHEKYVSDMKEISRNKTKLLQNNIKTPNMNFCFTDDSKEERYQPKTVLLTDEDDEKSFVLDISNENVVGINENLSDKYKATETYAEIISNKSCQKQKFSDIPIRSCINNNYFLLKEIIDISCSRGSFSQDSLGDNSSLSSLSVNSTESDTSDLAEQFGSILKISDRKNIVEDEPWKHIDFNEITLGDSGTDEDDDDDYDYNVTKDNDFTDEFSLSQPFWNSRGLQHLQTPKIPKDNKNGRTPSKRPFDDGYRCNDSNCFKNSYIHTSNNRSTHNILRNDSSQITSEKRQKTPPIKEKVTINNSENCIISSYVTENIAELRDVYEYLDIKFPSDDSPIPSSIYPEPCSTFDPQSNGYQELPVSDPSFEVSTECCNSKIAKDEPHMQEVPNSCQNPMHHTPAQNPMHHTPHLMYVICHNITAPEKRKINQQQIDLLTKEDFCKIDESGTYLHKAAENNDAYLLEALLKQLDKLQFKQHVINFKNNYQQTALHLAVTKNFPSMVHLLIKYGADVNILAKSCQEDSSKFEAPLHSAASRLKRMLVKELLTAKDIDLDLKNSEGQTALHCAVQAPHSPGPDKTFIISKLIKMKANPSCKDKEQGKNILMYAIEFYHYDVISVILKTASCKHIKKMMTDKSDKGETCLTLVTAFDKNHELFFKQCKLKQTLQDYYKKVAGEPLQEEQPHPLLENNTFEHQ